MGFKRWEYNLAMASPGQNPNAPPQATYTETGYIKFAAPDKGVFKVEQTLAANSQDKWEKIPDSRAMHWMCDGKSVYQYDYVSKILREFPLPPELQGKGISKSPLPFLFSSDAKSLSERYFLKASVKDNPNEVWLEAYPKYQEDAANFSSASLIMSVDPKTKEMTPAGMMLNLPGGQNKVTFLFFNQVVNKFRPFGDNAFNASVPLGWQKQVEGGPTAGNAPPANTAPGNAAPGNQAQRIAPPRK